MTEEYRAIVRGNNGTEIPFHYSFMEPDAHWGGYYHNLRAHEVVRWEKRTHHSDGSTTAWKAVQE